MSQFCHSIRSSSRVRGEPVASARCRAVCRARARGRYNGREREALRDPPGHGPSLPEPQVGQGKVGPALNQIEDVGLRLSVADDTNVHRCLLKSSHVHFTIFRRLQARQRPDTQKKGFVEQKNNIC